MPNGIPQDSTAAHESEFSRIQLCKPCSSAGVSAATPALVKQVLAEIVQDNPSSVPDVTAGNLPSSSPFLESSERRFVPRGPESGVPNAAKGHKLILRIHRRAGTISKN